MPGIFKFVLFLIPIFFLTGCSTKEPVTYENIPGEAHVIRNVPFVKQKDEFCGPAAMASVMRFYGESISQDEVAEVVYTPKLKGALISDMSYYANEMGFRSESRNGSFDELISLLNRGTPVIALVDLGKWMVSVPHYYVVYGYDKSQKNFLLHTGFKAGKEISFADLDSEWKKMNRLMLVVTK